MKSQMQKLDTSDYRGQTWPKSSEDEEDGYPLYVCFFDFISRSEIVGPALL